MVLIIYLVYTCRQPNLHHQPGIPHIRQRSPATSKAWAEAVQLLDPKTQALAYLAVLAALRLESGVPFHVKTAKQLGASREEVISAVLAGLPAAGHVVTQVLPAALAAYGSG